MELLRAHAPRAVRLAYGFVEFRTHVHAEQVAEPVGEVGAAAAAQHGKDAPLQFRLLVCLDHAAQGGHGLLDRGDDVAGEQFRHVVDEAGEEVVEPARRAGVHGQTEEIGVGRDQEHVPEHGGFRDARRLGPAGLEAQLPEQPGEMPERRLFAREKPVGQVRHAREVREPGQSAGKRRFDVEQLVVPGVVALYERIFPAAGVEVGGVEDAPRRGVGFGHGEVGRKPAPEVVAELAHARLELPEHPGRQLRVMVGVGLDLVENRRLDVGDDQPVEVLEQPSLNDLEPQRQFFGLAQMGAVALVEHPGDHHLVGLLVHLHEVHGAVFVVPAFHEGTGEEQLEKAFADADHEGSREDGVQAV
ncbi:hypothetical protein DSECCO2_623300 [anaerobic digester metagenome]